jgi:hypothetical protein
MKKLRHTAALALMGWYLMVPPWDKSGVYPATPLSQWTDYEGSYDTAQQCSEAKEQLLAEVKQDASKTPSAAAYSKYTDAIIFARCIATDDPRLRGGE